nr:MAG TPA: hypothetical protein [Caudoviricetes sp.]
MITANVASFSFTLFIYRHLCDDIDYTLVCSRIIS